MDVADDLPLYGMPGHLIRRLQQTSVAIFAEEMAEAGIDLTPVQYAALRAVEAYPHLDQATLAGVIAYDRTTIGGVVDRLEAKGLVQRRLSPTDRRVRQLVLQPAGVELLRRVDALVENVQDRIVSPLTAQEKKLFLKLATKLVMAHNGLARAPLRPLARRAAVPAGQ